MDLTQRKQIELETLRIPAPPGAPTRAPIIFLHEGLGSVAIWRSREGFWPEQVCAATGRAGLVYSRPGYGASAPIADVRGANRHRPDYMHRAAREVLPALLAEHGIERPVLLGHSDGATIALLHAATHPVSACIVMAPHVIVEDVSIRAIEAAREAYLQGDLRARLARYHADVDNAFWQWNDIWLDPAFRVYDIRPECRSITASVLAIQGLDDPYGTLRQIDEIAPAGPITRHALAGCGHSPHRDQPGQTLEAIQGFLAALD